MRGARICARGIARSPARSMASSRWPISGRARKASRRSARPGTTMRPRRSARPPSTSRYWRSRTCRSACSSWGSRVGTRIWRHRRDGSSNNSDRPRSAGGDDAVVALRGMVETVLADGSAARPAGDAELYRPLEYRLRGAADEWRAGLHAPSLRHGRLDLLHRLSAEPDSLEPAGVSIRRAADDRLVHGGGGPDRAAAAADPRSAVLLRAPLPAGGGGDRNDPARPPLAQRLVPEEPARQ